MASGVYKIRNIKNEKVYIGSSKNLHKRKLQHFSSLKKGKNNTRLRKEYMEYGKDSFIFEVIETCIEDKLVEREQYWIDTLESWKEEKGYNVFKEAGDIFKSGLYKKNTIKGSRRKINTKSMLITVKTLDEMLNDIISAKTKDWYLCRNLYCIFGKHKKEYILPDIKDERIIIGDLLKEGNKVKWMTEVSEYNYARYRRTFNIVI